jgi:hypothetical protein
MFIGKHTEKLTFSSLALMMWEAVICFYSASSTFFSQSKNLKDNNAKNAHINGGVRPIA